MVAALSLDAHATRNHVAIYYWCTAVLVLAGGWAWVAVVRSPPAQHYFKLKDGAAAREEQLSRPAAATAPQPPPHASEKAWAAPGRPAASASNPGRSSSSRSSGYSPPRDTPASGGASDSEVQQRYAFVPTEAAAAASPAEPSFLATSAEVKEPLGVAVRNCRLALFINIWSSIFVGAFFA